MAEDCLIVGSEDMVEDCSVESENVAEDCLIATEVSSIGISAAKTRKISYTPTRCYLCDVMDNPKKMTSLRGNSKNEFREVIRIFKNIDEQEDSEAEMLGSKICKNCTEKVLKEINGCFICGEIIRDPKMKRGISHGRFKDLAIEERLCFQGVNSKREPLEYDQSCLCCQKRILNIIDEEAAGNTMKMKVVLQRSKKACIVCRETNDLRDFPRNGRIKMFIQTGMFTGQGSKICSQHLVGEDIIPSLCNGLIAIERQIVIHPSEVVHWLNALRSEINRPKKDRYNDVDSFDDCDLKALTSLTKQNFEDMFSFLDSYRDTDRSKCHKVDLVCFLSKMRQGLSDEFLRAMFGYKTRQSVSAAITRVRKGLVEKFVPKYLGLQAISREELIDKHVPDYAQELYNPSPSEKKAILILDGTYIYIPKSTNYRVLRQSFCVHKGSHLVKPIMVVTPDGWIVDVHGPYFSDGKNNDAECLRDAMADVNGLKEYLMPSDILLVDKGYDHVVQHLSEDHGLSVFMPKFLDKGKKQYTTEEANSTRLVTATRWVVEARNGHLKSIFKLFRSMVPMQHVKHIGDFVRIGCAIINAYFKPITMSHATVDWAKEMMAQSKKQNKLRKFVEENKLQGQRKNWEIMSSDSLPEFPRLTYDYLRKLTFGVYQIKLARSYVQDKVQNESQFNFKIHKQRPGLIRIQTKSRFSGSKKRNLWIVFKDPLLTADDELYDKDDEGPILGWCCDCPNGARSLGCCAHVVSVLWYLGLARHQSNPFPSNELLHAVKDCSKRPIPIIDLNGLPRPVISNKDVDEDSDDDEELDLDVRTEVIEVECDENGQFYFDDMESEESNLEEYFSNQSMEQDDFINTAEVGEI